MSRTVQIGNGTYEIPDNLESPGWGEGLSDYLEAVADALGTVQNAEDILQTSATINNNQTSSANITLLAFSTSRILSFTIEYYIERVYDGGTILVEDGFITGNYDGTTFNFTRESSGTEAGVVITVTAGGQFQYTSSNLTSQTSGIITFKAKTIIDS